MNEQYIGAPCIGELVATKNAPGHGKAKYTLGLLIDIKDWEYPEKYVVEWLDDGTICDYTDDDFQTFRVRMVEVRQEHGL